ncbi:MAG: cupin domain-containing protein [Vicinamibacteria bacterium]|nr:cupin domain-containing protein [Vicinamibacteria bacterium]
MTTPATEPDEGDLEIAARLADVVPQTLEAVPLTAAARTRLLDLLEVPRRSIDRAAYAWVDVGPGLKLHLVSEDPARGVRRCLVWGIPGARTPRHGHTGDEMILVLEGQLKDERGSYGPGDICRSSSADIHQEQVVGDVDCVCFVVYYGDLIPV